LGECDEKVFRSTDVAKPIRVLISDDFADELRACGVIIVGGRRSASVEEYDTVRLGARNVNQLPFCVRTVSHAPRNPGATWVYRHTATRIDVAEVVDSEVR
jgi:hypothetical protein